MLLKLVLHKRREENDEKNIHCLTLIVANCYGMQKYSSFKVCLLTSQLLSTERGQMMRVVLAFKSSVLSAMEDSAPAHVKKKKPKSNIK